ncbi:MAG: hypothetical protein M3O22_08775 [Pseudomonadota bacterium]|nr:hypothetical protein [Pseudomonadota bacterium]
MTPFSEPVSPSFWTRRLSRREVWVYRGVYALPWVGTLVAAVVMACMELMMGLEPQGLESVPSFLWLPGLLMLGGIVGQIVYIPLAALLFFIIPRLSVRGNILLALGIPLLFTVALHLFLVGIRPAAALLILSLGISYFYALPGVIIMFLYSRAQDKKTGVTA